MAATALARSAPDRDDERGSDVRVEKLVLDVVSNKRKSLDARIDDALSSGEIRQSMSDGTSLTLEVLDPDDELLLSGMFDHRIDAELDEIPFRLVTVERGDDGLLTLEFEHRLIAYFREHTKPRKFSRGKYTRAEAAKILVSEVKKGGPIRFVSRSLHKKQPIQNAKQQPTRAARDSSREEGFSDSADVKVQGRSLRRRQLENADRILSVAASHNAGPKATLALVEACIIEPAGYKGSGPFDNPAGGDATSVGILQLLSMHGSVEERRDVEAVATKFLTEGFTGKGGAIAIAKANPSMSAGIVAAEVQGPRSDLRGRYDQVKEDAQRVIDAWGGEGETFGGGGTYYKRFEFTRGQPEKRENTWETLQRWANDVRWRVFVVGKHTVYFTADDDLMKSRARYTITPDTLGVTSVRFKLEVGKRTVARKGRRDPKPSTMTIRARLDRWAAPPGTVIEVQGYGQADGRWLVDTITRPVFDAEGTIECRQPQKQLPEPRPETGTRGPGDIEGVGEGVGGEGVNAVYEAALTISEKKYPYVWGGGHARAGHADGGTGRDPGTGYDCSGYTAACLKAGDMLPSAWERGVPASGTFASTWGEAGEGEHLTVWANGTHVWIEFVTRKARADTSPNTTGGDSGARVRPMPRQTAGFTPRHWKGDAPTRSHPLGSSVSKHRSGNG